MKKLFSILSLLILTLSGFSQTTLVNGIQVKNQAGAPSGTTPGSNAGLVVSDGNGLQTKKSILAAIGSRARQVIALNDSTLQVITDSATYTFKVRGTFTPARQGYLDSLRAGLIKDTTFLNNQGGGVSLGYVSPNQDTIKLRTVKDSVIKCIAGPDSALRFFIVANGVQPGRYGDQTHIPIIRVRADGIVDSAGSVLISLSGAGVSKKTLNTQPGTSYTLTAQDTSTYITATNASPVTIIVPDDASVSMASPVNLDIYQLGSGKVTVTPLNGNVTISAAKGRFKTLTQYSKVTLNKLSSNNWVLTGDLDTTTVAYLTATPNSIVNFAATTGGASPPQTFHLYGGNLTGNASLVAPTNFEVSLDNTTYAGTTSVTPSAGNIGDQLVYVRSKSTAPSGPISGTLNVTATGAATSVFLSGTVGTVPTITPSGTLSAFSTSAGLASTAQTFTFTATNLTASVVWTAGTGMEVSSNGTTYGQTATFTQSGGSSSGTVSVRIAAATTSGSYSGVISGNTTGIPSPATVAYSATVNASTAVSKFNFSSSASAVAGWTNVFGDPTLSPSFTDAGTGYTWSMIGAGWSKFSGFYGGVGNGATAGSSDGAFSQASINSNLYSYNLGFSLTGYNAQVSNLPAGTYSVELIGSIPTSVYNTGGPAAFHVQFGTGSDNISTFTPNDNLTAVGPGTTGVQTGSFTGVITSGQTIKIAICTSGAGQLGLINGVIITKIN